MEFTVLLFYRFLPLHNLDALQKRLNDSLSQIEIKGRILIAPEGINGTLSLWNETTAVNEVINLLIGINEDFRHVDWKTSTGCGDKLPFVDLFIRAAKELIGTGLLASDALSHCKYSTETYGGLAERSTGVHCSPETFHEHLVNSGDKVILLDVRNDIEYKVGHFEGAINLGTSYYSESWRAIDRIIAENQSFVEKPESKVMMYCTGGIRCEKASAYLIGKGVPRDKILQLEGGVHRYLQRYPAGLYRGKNYVFDERTLTRPDQYCWSPSKNASAVTPASSFCCTSSSGLSSSPAEVTSQCALCGRSCETLSGDRRCAVCRLEVIVCDLCAQTNSHPGEYHCAVHSDLRGCYFKQLSRASLMELKMWADELRDKEKALLPLGRRGKNKRRTLRNQVNRINEMISTISPDVIESKNSYLGSNVT